MLSPELAQLAAMALAGIAVGGVVYALAIPYMSGERKAGKRFSSVTQGQRTDRRRAGPILANTQAAGAGHPQGHRG